MKYTAEEFTNLAQHYEKALLPPLADVEQRIIAALRIAARVTEPGYLEQTTKRHLIWNTYTHAASDIRKALTDPPEQEKAK